MAVGLVKDYCAAARKGDSSVVVLAPEGTHPEVLWDLFERAIQHWCELQEKQCRSA